MPTIGEARRPVNLGSTPVAWSRQAPALAAWTWRRLVNRTDVYGGYLPLALRTGSNKSLTKPRRADRGRVFLTLGILERHFIGALPEHVVGLHSTSPENTCRSVATDLDFHGEGGSDPGANLRAALAWHAKLTDLGFRPLLAASNGQGGYHLRVIFDRPVPSERAFAFIVWLTSDFSSHGLTNRPEVFPKQPRLLSGRYGNWLRLPGRHHTRDYWSKVWDRSRPLDGAEAIEFILALTGDDPALIPNDIEPPRPRVAVAPRVARPYRAPCGADLVSRIRAKMAEVPNRAEGEGRGNNAWYLAAWLTHDLDLSTDAALPWVREWNQGNRPPLDASELERVVANAKRYGRNAAGCGLVALPPVRAAGPSHPRRHRSDTFTVNGGAL
jgi:hypothetical protein